LSARLDAFIKYELFTHYLAERGHSWMDVPANEDLLSQLALLDHDYHAISTPESAFSDLEGRGVLAHRSRPLVVAGSEPEPFVPDVRTRARPRARFIKDHAQDRGLNHRLTVSWDFVREFDSGRTHKLHDPFATEFATRERPVGRGRGGDAQLQMPW
jgi:hypothetical protein